MYIDFFSVEIINPISRLLQHKNRRNLIHFMSYDMESIVSSVVSERCAFYSDCVSSYDHLCDYDTR